MLRKLLGNKRLVRTLQYGLAIIPFIWISSKINLHDLGSAIRQTAPWTLPFVIFAVGASMTLHGVRWWLLVRASAPGFRLSHALHVHFVSAFYSTVLPSGLAQDIVRGALVSRHIDYKSVWGGTWIFKLMGMAAWVIILFCSLPFLGSTIVDSNTKPLLIAGIVMLLALIGVSFSKKLSRPLRMIGNLLPSNPVVKALGNVRQGIYEFRAHPGTLTSVFALTLFTQLLNVVGLAVTLYGICRGWFLPACMAFLPLVEFVSAILPITPNGLGLREGMAAVTFARLGLSPAEIGVYVMLNFIGPLMKLACGVFVLFEHKPDASKA